MFNAWQSELLVLLALYFYLEVYDLNQLLDTYAGGMNVYIPSAKSSFLLKGLYQPTEKLKSTLRADNETEILRNRSLRWSVHLLYYISRGTFYISIFKIYLLTKYFKINISLSVAPSLQFLVALLLDFKNQKMKYIG